MKNIISKLLLVALSASAIFTMTGCGVDYAEAVKSSTLDDFDKKRTIGQVFDENKFFSSVKWNTVETKSGKPMVVATCKLKDITIDSLNFTQEQKNMFKTQLGQVALLSNPEALGLLICYYALSGSEIKYNFIIFEKDSDTAFEFDSYEYNVTKKQMKISCEKMMKKDNMSDKQLQGFAEVFLKEIPEKHVENNEETCVSVLERLYENKLPPLL